MDVIADFLMAAGALGAAVYCIVLGRRLRRFTDLETGVGGAVAVLSAQVDDLTRALARGTGQAADQAATLSRSSERAEAVAGRLELLLAALHDLPEPGPAAAQPSRADAPVARVFVRQSGAAR
jgi:hypothetical protein